MSNAKVIINTQAVSIELEGEDGFVRTYLDKLMPIIERSRATTTDLPKVAAPSAPELKATPVVVEQPAEVAPAAVAVSRGSKRVAGNSCRDKIKVLRGEGFFDDQRSISDVAKALRAKGHEHNLNQVGAALSTMHDRGEIQRQSVDGRFKYSWSEMEHPKAA
ncbi:hypothetical protein IB262_33245 [Ensifer sp. ENS02]|uniref:hypothetical protein n=1 Tax=Ensifer sp. ENS02 TaxID=2769290 RepID=UPI0017826555|nr:hypothetical protein [Ensifer sp. ENS02]MBD9524744.1 hypothetical protein [Ensifer sp. ENS02]